MRTHRTLAAALAAAGIVSAAVAASTPAGDARAGRALAFAECRGCHGMDGKGIGPGVPSLAGRDAAYLMAALEEYRAGKRVHSPIREIARNAKPQELRDIAAYYAGLPPLDAQPSKGAK
jgi:cytochrome c553